MVSKFELNLIKSPGHHFIIVSLEKKIRSNQNKQKITKTIYFSDHWLSIDITYHVVIWELEGVSRRSKAKGIKMKSTRSPDQ